MAEDKPDNSTEANIKSEMKVAARLKKQRPSTFTPRSPSVASEAQNIFQGAQKGMQSAFQAAQFGDESLAFFAGAGGAFGGPSAQEIENQFVKHEMAAEQQALMQANIMDVAPDQVAEASKFYGADLSGLTVGQFAQMQPIMADAAKAKAQQAVKSKQQPLELEEAKALASGYTSDPKKIEATAKGMVAANHNGESGSRYLNSIFRVGVSEGRLAVSQQAQNFKEKVQFAQPDDLEAIMAFRADEMRKNPALAKIFSESIAKNKNVSAKLAGEINSQIGMSSRQESRFASAKEMAVEARNFSVRRMELQQQFQRERENLTDDERHMWSVIMGEPIPKGLRSANVRQLAQASRLTSAASKDREKAVLGVEKADELLAALRGAGRAEVFISKMEKDSIGDGLRAFSDSYFNTKTEEINQAETFLQDLITRQMTGAALNKEEEVFYGRLIVRWAASPARNSEAIDSLRRFFVRIKEDIDNGRRVPGKKFDSVLFGADGSFREEPGTSRVSSEQPASSDGPTNSFIPPESDIDAAIKRKGG